MSKRYSEVEDGQCGDRVKCPDGQIGTVLYFTPGHFTTHAVVQLPEGNEERIRLDELVRVSSVR